MKSVEHYFLAKPRGESPDFEALKKDYSFGTFREISRRDDGSVLLGLRPFSAESWFSMSVLHSYPTEKFALRVASRLLRKSGFDVELLEEKTKDILGNFSGFKYFAPTN